MALPLGDWAPIMSATVSSRVRTRSAVGWMKMVRMIAATFLSAPMCAVASASINSRTSARR
ncbi:hypothetical protein ABZX85_47580 [Streptomyces sp. NPDC004539]|uniref:hypothetical protein n=1 Tax=Streptomyces sp. NPDC004539 TaxID=3154280 RepID=UPI0033A46FB2